jgi:DNA-directed RNA polymerase III subunit RPC8
VETSTYPGAGRNIVRRKSTLTWAPGAIVVGMVQESDKSGMRVSLSFFDDVFIPAANMQSNSRFDVYTGLWVWQFGDVDLYMDKFHKIRFRVQEVRYAALEKKLPAMEPNVMGEDDDDQLSIGGGGDGGAEELYAARKPPMTVIGSVAENLLGMMTWWAASPAAADGDEEEEEEAEAEGMEEDL